jgi:hypothetical protein
LRLAKHFKGMALGNGVDYGTRYKDRQAELDAMGFER